MEEIIKYGKKLIAAGLTDSHFGNISKRVGDEVLITTTGSMLDELENEVVRLPLHHSSSLDIVASSELIVHRKIYQQTSALAIIHAHPVYAVIESLITEENQIIPTDCESEYFLHEIPIVTGGIGSSKLATNSAQALQDHKGVIVKGHGVFARGSTVDEAYVVISSIEHACQIKYHVDLFQAQTHKKNNPSILGLILTIIALKICSAPS